MSSTSELVYLAEGSAVASWCDRPLKFIAAPFMGQRPEQRRGEGVSFGTFLTRDGPKTGWLFVPNPSSRNAAGQQLGEHLRAANPGLSKAALERLELGQLRYQFAEQMLWPNEKPTWTAGAVLLAVDALTHHTSASGLFLSPALED